MNLFTPGPVNIPQRIVGAMSQQPLHHRSAEFLEISKHVWQNLADIFFTNGIITILSGSGMTGIEACISSVHTAGDKIVVVNNGRFGERIANICRLYGLDIIELSVEWGQSINPDEIADVIKNIDDVRGLWLVHSETSTGVLLDLQEICKYVHNINPSILICIDAVTSVAIHEFDMLSWGVDVAIAGIQKGFMCPPGLACCALSEMAIDRVLSNDAKSYTMNLKTIIENQRRGLFTWTPPVTLLAALQESVDMILQEGLNDVYTRHSIVASAIRSGFLERGFKLFGEATSNALVCVETPFADNIKQSLYRNHNIVVAGGQDRLSGKIFRVGTCGDRTLTDVDVFFNAFDEVVRTENVTP